jgi:hypothetical protein
MSQFFSGKTGLRHQYEDLTAADLALATSAATAVLLIEMNQATRIGFIDNTLDQDVILYATHPEADGTVATNRLFWLEVPSNRVLNYESSFPHQTIDPGTKIYVSVPSAPFSGKLRIVVW